MDLQNRFHKALMQSGSLPEGGRVLVAVSGGADSVALLHLLHAVSKSMSLHLEAAHLDHSLRDSSRQDAEFVQDLCEAISVPLTLERFDVAETARRCKGNLEEVARDQRREFLQRTAILRGCEQIALGHHSDDQAETFLMRLLRGAGPAGLAGMREQEGAVIRPLLSFTHAELVDFLQQKGFSWKEDESNLDQSYTRNRIRHQLLPSLNSYNPNITERLNGLCAQLQRDNEYWAEMVATELARCGRWQDQGYVLDRELVVALAPALAARVVRGALAAVRGDLRGLSSAHIQDVLRLLVSDSPQGELDLPHVWVARRYNSLVVRREKPEVVAYYEVELNCCGSYRLPGGRTLTLSKQQVPGTESPGVVEFPADLTFPLQLRSPRPGDRLRPSGMVGRKKIQDLFVDMKLTREQRQNALLLLKDEEILWALGFRRAEALRPRAEEPVLRFVLGP